MVRKITKWHPLMLFLGDYRRHAMLADMERELGVPHQTIRKYASLLVNKGILLEERKPKNVIYSLNKDNPMVLNYLSSAEKIALEEILERDALLKRLYEMLSEHMSDANFLIFGSSAGKKSGRDIDLLATGGRGVKGAASKFERTYGRKIHLVQPGESGLTKALLKEIMKRHIILNGFDAFIKLFWEASWKG